MYTLVEVLLNTLRNGENKEERSNMGWLLPRSHIHGSPRRFHYGSDLTDDPGNAIFRSLIRVHNGVATSFDVSAKRAFWWHDRYGFVTV